ncbi:hypothetical protein BGX31_002943 [Mortierella sp. GBA43]|nr:hypothetical protein BGX31_002943 [Mortierella sp. GBA43]
MLLHPPISVHHPQPGDVIDQDVDMSMMHVEENPIEVTLNIDIPKMSSLAAAGDSSATVLNVNPSWHCVFMETVQQQCTRASIRVQFCPSPVSPTLNSHREKISQLKTLQVIGYASQQVEWTLRICGQNLLRKGGILVHLDPLAINYNDASYGFTLSFSSIAAETLCMENAARMDEALPLARQQNSAYCRRNLKELYYDALSKDVTIKLQPSGDLVYAHSVVLENYAHFRALLERAIRELGSSSGVSAGPDTSADPGVGSSTGVEAARHEEREHGDMSQAVVDEEGYAQPLYPPPTQQPQQPQQQRQQYQPQRGLFRARQDDGDLLPMNRSEIKIEVQNISQNVFRAILHYMYIGHIPTTVRHLAPPSSHPFPQPSTATTHPSSEESAPSFPVDPPPVNPQASVPHSQQSGAEGSSQGAEPGLASTSTSAGPSTQPPTANADATPDTVFSWRELYETASRFQLAGLMHLTKLVLISRLDIDLAIRELFEWAYRHWTLVPSYTSFLIENMDPNILRYDKSEEEGRGLGLGMNAGPEGKVSKTIFWRYHDQCPRFDDIMVMFLQMLNERKSAGTLV